MGRLDNKVALITGGARGQGEAEGRLFRAEGAEVYLTDVLVDEGKQAAADMGATFIEHDVSDRVAWAAVIDQVMEEHGRIDVLINNAGIFAIADIEATDEKLWNRMLAVNQTGVLLGMQAVIPAMKAQQSGSIINISSIAGLQGTAACIAYGATKWAVRGMTRSAAKGLAADGVRVNSIHPGIIDTPMVNEFDEAGLLEAVTESIPNGAMAEATEVANLALYLASDESRYSTGSEFVVDGGMTA